MILSFCLLISPVTGVIGAAATSTATDEQVITRNTSNGEVYQRGTLTDGPTSVSAGETVSVTVNIAAMQSGATDNIVYGAIGLGDGTVYAIEQMDGLGTGTVTVIATVPSNATGDVYWTWVPTVSDSTARDKARLSFEAKTGDNVSVTSSTSFGGDGVLAYKLDSVGFSEDGGNATNTGDSPLEGAPGEFDNDGDGIISQGELGEAAFAFATGQVGQAELSEVAFAFATRADTPSRTSYTISELEWTTNTSGTALVEIGPESLTSTVYKCERATSSTQLGVTDSVVVNFDYELVADQWWEVPVLEVYVDGERVYRGTGSERFTGERLC